MNGIDMSDIFTLPPKALLIKLLTPIAAGFIMLMCIDFADLVVAGYISDIAIAILGYSYALIYFMIAIGFGLNQGLTIIGSEVNIKFGTKALYHTFLQSIALSIIATGFLSLLTIALLKLPGLRLQWVDPEIMPYFDMLQSYMLMILWAILPMFLLLLVCAICQIKGKPEVIRDTLAAMLILTVILHPILVLSTNHPFTFFHKTFYLPIGLGLGITGIALSKLTVTVFGLVFSTLRVIDYKLFYSSNLRLDLKTLSVLSQQSLPAAGIQSLVPAYLIMLTKTITGFGIEVLAGFTLGYRIVMVVIIPILGVLVALLVVMTHDLVAKQIQRVKDTLKISLLWGSLIVFITLLLSNLLTIVGFDFWSGDNKDIIAQQYLILALYITVLEYIIGICIVSFQSVRQPLTAFFVASLRTILIPAPILYWLSIQATSILDIWYGLAVSFTLAGLGSMAIWYKYFWKKALC